MRLLCSKNITQFIERVVRFTCFNGTTAGTTVKKLPGEQLAQRHNNITT